MVSGIAIVMLVYMVISCFRKKVIEVDVLDSIGKFLFFVLLLDFTLEGLDQIQRIYEAEESFEIIKLAGIRQAISYTICRSGFDRNNNTT